MTDSAELVGDFLDDLVVRNGSSFLFYSYVSETYVSMFSSPVVFLTELCFDAHCLVCFSATHVPSLTISRRYLYISSLGFVFLIKFCCWLVVVIVLSVASI